MTARLLILAHRYAGLSLLVFAIALGLSGGLMLLEGNVLRSSFVAESYRLEPAEQRAAVSPILERVEVIYREKPRQISVRGGGFPDEYRLGGRRTVFVDPYRGEILGEAPDFRTAFSRTLWDFHATLLLGDSGRWLVGIASAVLFFSTLLGLCIYLPQLKRRGSSSLSLRPTRARLWLRRLHNCGGLYGAPILLVIAFTGCFMAFQPVQSATLRLLGSPVTTPPLVLQSKPGEGRQAVSVDVILSRLELPAAPGLTLHLGLPLSESATYSVRHSGPRANRYASLFFDQYSGEAITVPQLEAQQRAIALQRFIRSLHYGSFANAVFKPLWFFACLLLVLLSASGWLMWRRRQRQR